MQYHQYLKKNQGRLKTTNFCSIKETARQSLKIIATSQFYQNMKGISYWNWCHIYAHVSVPTTSVSEMTGVNNFTCFEIMHIKDIYFFVIDGN